MAAALAAAQRVQALTARRGGGQEAAPGAVASLQDQHAQACIRQVACGGHPCSASAQPEGRVGAREQVWRWRAVWCGVVAVAGLASAGRRAPLCSSYGRTCHACSDDDYISLEVLLWVALLQDGVGRHWMLAVRRSSGLLPFTFCHQGRVGQSEIELMYVATGRTPWTPKRSGQYY